MEQIFQKYNKYLYCHIRSKVPPMDAEDICSDVFASLLKHQEYLENQRNLKGLLLTIAERKIISFYRKDNSRFVSYDIDCCESYYRRSDEIVAARKIFFDLTLIQREVFLKRALLEHTIKEVADMLNITVQQVRSEIKKIQLKFIN
jgi:RNA polymerase sigma factor (sigma-70 family)